MERNANVKKIYYEKIGDEYVAVSEYDSNFMDSLRRGTHLVVSNPGHTSYTYNIDPAYAPLIAASKIALDSMVHAISNATEVRLASSNQSRLTEEQKQAWDRLIEVFGPSARHLNHASAYDVAQAGVTALIEEAKTLLTNETVKSAYDQFLVVAELTKNHNER